MTRKTPLPDDASLEDVIAYVTQYGWHYEPVRDGRVLLPYVWIYVQKLDGTLPADARRRVRMLQRRGLLGRMERDDGGGRGFQVLINR